MLDESKRTWMEHRPGAFCVWSDGLCISVRTRGLCKKAEAKLNSRWKGNPSVTLGCWWSGLVIKNATTNRKLQSEPLRIYQFCLSTPTTGDPWTFIFLRGCPGFSSLTLSLIYGMSTFPWIVPSFELYIIRVTHSDDVWPQYIIKAPCSAVALMIC